MKKKGIVLVLMVLLLSLQIPSAKVLAEPGSVSITRQPEDVVVTFPEGASFSIEVNDPDAVVSYQWVMVDIEGTEFVLDGVTAKTDTLVIPFGPPA